MLQTLSMAAALAAPPRLELLRDELVPEIEAATGRSFAGEPPPVRWVSAIDLALEAQREGFGLARLWMPDLEPDAAEASRYASPTPPGLVGKYLLFTREILVSREGLSALDRELAQAGVKVGKEAVARCVLAHELVHALQAREGAFEAAVHDPERFLAMEVVAEGHATLVSEVLCDPAVVAPLRARLGFDRDEPPSPYALGAAFLAGRLDQAWSLLSPADTAAVLWPDRAPPPPAEPPWAALDAAVRALLPDVPVHHLPLGALDLRSAGGPATEDPLRSMRGAWQAVAGAGAGIVTVRAVRFGDEALARAWLGATRAHLGELHGAGRFAVSTRGPAPVEGLPAEEAYGYTRSLNLLMGGAPPPRTIRGWAAVAGPWGVEIELLDVERSADAASTALATLRQLR